MGTRRTRILGNRYLKLLLTNCCMVDLKLMIKEIKVYYMPILSFIVTYIFVKVSFNTEIVIILH